MFQFLTIGQREALVAAQRTDFQNLDWLSHKTSDMAKKEIFADTVYNQVTTLVNTVNPIPMIFDRVTGEAGKKIVGKRIFGGQVFERSYGEFKRKSSFKTVYYTMTTSAKSISFSWPVEELRNGIVTLADIIESCTQAIIYHKVKLAWDTLKDAILSTDSTNNTNVGGTLTQSSLDGAIKSQSDKWRIAGIIGRRSYLDTALTFSGGSGADLMPESIKEDAWRRGLMQVYHGAPIFALPQLKDEITGALAMDASTCFIVSEYKGFNRYVEVAPVTSSNWITYETGEYNQAFDWEDGFAVWDNTFLHRLSAA